MRRLLSLTLLLLLSLVSIPAQQGMGPGPGAKSYTVGETNFVNDTFTETSDLILSSHTPELGGPLVDHPNGSYADTANVVGSTDRAAMSSGTGGTLYTYTATPPSADYCVEGVIFVASVITVNTSIAARFDTAVNTGYIFQLNNGTGWRVRKIVTGTQTTIGTEDTTTNLPSVGQSRTMKMCLSGSTITAFVDGSLLSGVGGTDSAITAAGKAAVRWVGAQSTTTGFHFESFRAFTP